jgi:DNA-binding Lrp family transcriptional regulator
LNLTSLQRRLCNTLQQGLPICKKPFEEIAKNLDSDEKEVLNQTLQLQKEGILRRISPIINYSSLGRVSTLVTAQVEENKLQEVADTVNALENVSHNYLRKHKYNLWFTLQGACKDGIQQTLNSLQEQFGLTFHSLPALRIFKLDVRFDAEENQTLAEDKNFQVAQNKKVELSEIEIQILSGLQEGIKIISKPFNSLCSLGLEVGKVIEIIHSLIQKSVIRRIAGVLDHRKLGYEANVMFVCEVPKQDIMEVGRRLASFRAVSHCYERKTFQGWPYNLFAMIHARNYEQIQQIIKAFTKAENIESFALLETGKELKKQPVKYRFV